MNSKTLLRFSTFSCLTLLLAACGGGGSGGSNDSGNNSNYTAPTPTSSLSLSADKGYVGESITISWSSTNASSCSATNAWTTSNNTSGSATVTPDTAGSLTFEMTCSGDGGSDSASASLQVFQYDKLSDSVANKNWDAAAMAVITQGIFEGNGFLSDFDYSGDANNQLTVSAFESSDTSFEIGFSGSTANGDSFDYNLVSSNWHSTENPLYVPDDAGTAAYGLISASDADNTAEGFRTLSAYNASLGIDYVSLFSLDMDDDPSHYIFTASMGEFTQADDMPSSGSISKELYSLGFYYEATAADGNPHGDQVLTDGQGSLEFDFTNNTVSGSIDYRTFIPYTNFSAGETTYDLITSVSGQILNLQNGTISGNTFTADAILSNYESTAETIEVSIEANANGSGNVYVIDGVQKKSLTMVPGVTYTFNHAGAHPLRFSTTDDGTHNGGSAYTTGVTTSNGVTTIEITSETPTTLYYYCQLHSGMGADISVSNTGVRTATGTVKGHFYGPNADEIGFNLLMVDDNDDDTDFFMLSAGGLGQTE